MRAGAETQRATPAVKVGSELPSLPCRVQIICAGTGQLGISLSDPPCTLPRTCTLPLCSTPTPPPPCPARRCGCSARAPRRPANSAAAAAAAHRCRTAGSWPPSDRGRRRSACRGRKPPPPAPPGRRSRRRKSGRHRSARVGAGIRMRMMRTSRQSRMAAAATSSDSLPTSWSNGGRHVRAAHGADLLEEGVVHRVQPLRPVELDVQHPRGRGRERQRGGRAVGRGERHCGHDRSMPRPSYKDPRTAVSQL